MKENIIERLGLNSEMYKLMMVGDKEFALRVPKTREILRFESNNVSPMGTIDMYGYVSDVCALATPSLSMTDIVDVDEHIVLNLGTRSVSITNLNPKEAIDIMFSSNKINSDGEVKINLEGMGDRIINLLDEKIDMDDLTIKEARALLHEFQSAIDMTKLTEVFTFFQENFGG